MYTSQEVDSSLSFLIPIKIRTVSRGFTIRANTIILFVFAYVKEVLHVQTIVRIDFHVNNNICIVSKGAVGCKI